METKTTTKRHPFTENLGDGPFSYVGYFDLGSRRRAMEAGRDYAEVMKDAPRLKAGLGTCAHCGHAIMNIMIVRNGDGELFGVGSDCIRKVYADGDVEQLSKMERDIKTKKKVERMEREQAQFDKVMPEYTAALAKLANKPHPVDYYASIGKTLADYYEFVIRGSAISSKIKSMKRAVQLANTED